MGNKSSLLRSLDNPKDETKVGGLENPDEGMVPYKTGTPPKDNLELLEKEGLALSFEQIP